MRILGKVIKKDVVTKYVRPIIKTVCDDCGKEITDLYADITTSHRRWGNDSIDSVKNHQLCFDCAKKLFEKYTKEPEITDTFKYEVCNVAQDEKELEVTPEGWYLDDCYSFAAKTYQIEEED